MITKLFLGFIDILKEDGQSVECYTENWDKTHDYRIRQIGTYETLDDLLCQWPIIGKPIGLSLVRRFINFWLIENGVMNDVKLYVKYANVSSKNVTIVQIRITFDTFCASKSF